MGYDSYRITDVVTGTVIGTYLAQNKEEALDLMTQKAGTATDAEIRVNKLIVFGPKQHKEEIGMRFEHKRHGWLTCIACDRVVNEDQCGEWAGPSFDITFEQGA